MKKILLLPLFLSLFWACGKDAETEPREPENELTYEQKQMYARFDELGIKPSDRDSIDYFGGLVDSTSYKLAFGRKNGHAWLAKFTSSGEEIFSLEIKNIPSHRNYAHFNRNSPVFLNNSILFLTGWFTYN
jgi:hypothetical protein